MSADGEKHNPDRVWSCPRSVLVHRKVFISHSFAVMSAEAVASSPPVEAKATAVT